MCMSDVVWMVVLAMSDEDMKVEPWAKKLREVSDYQGKKIRYVG